MLYRQAYKIPHGEPNPPDEGWAPGNIEVCCQRAVPYEGLQKPQSWVYNCETGNRRVDVSEFVAWARACGRDPVDALRRFLKLI